MGREICVLTVVHKQFAPQEGVVRWLPFSDRRVCVYVLRVCVRVRSGDQPCRQPCIYICAQSIHRTKRFELCRIGRGESVVGIRSLQDNRSLLPRFRVVVRTPFVWTVVVVAVGCFGEYLREDVCVCVRMPLLFLLCSGGCSLESRSKLRCSTLRAAAAMCSFIVCSHCVCHYLRTLLGDVDGCLALAAGGWDRHFSAFLIFSGLIVLVCWVCADI